MVSHHKNIPEICPLGCWRKLFTGKYLISGTPKQKHPRGLLGKVPGRWVLLATMHHKTPQKILMMWKLGAEESVCTVGAWCHTKAHTTGTGPWESWVSCRSWTLEKTPVLQEPGYWALQPRKKTFLRQCYSSCLYWQSLKLWQLEKEKYLRAQIHFTEQTKRVKEPNTNKSIPGI